jgi:hypothetical protein
MGLARRISAGWACLFLKEPRERRHSKRLLDIAAPRLGPDFFMNPALTRRANFIAPLRGWLVA